MKAWDLNPLAHWKLELFDTENVLVEQMEGSGSPPVEVFLNKVQAQPAATYICKLQVQDIAGNQSIQEAQLQLGAGSQSATVSAARLTLMVGSFAQPGNAEMMAANLQRMNPDEKVQIYTAVVDAKTVHRVTIGEFAAREEATGLKQHIQETQGVEPVLITLQ